MGSRSLSGKPLKNVEWRPNNQYHKRRNSPVLILILLTSISFLLLLADLIERVRYNIPYLKSLFYLIAFRRNLSPVFSFLNFFLQSRVVRTLCVVRWLRLLSLILDWELLGTSRMELDTSEYCASFFFFFSFHQKGKFAAYFFGNMFVERLNAVCKFACWQHGRYQA